MVREGENHEACGLLESAGLYARSRGEEEESEPCRVGRKLLRRL